MFSEDMVGEYEEAFVFGTGGGNDMASAVLAAMYLQRCGVETDVGGLLSPAAVHTFDGAREGVVNEIKGEVRRFLPFRESVEISFIDGHLPEFVSDAGIEIPRFYDLSIRYGTDELAKGVNELIRKNGYDLVVAVDVGGDILARGAEDSTLLSPAMDFTSLNLLGRLDVDSLLVEFGLGTDGELRPDGMQEILEEVESKDLMVSEGEINSLDFEVRKFKEVFDRVRQIRYAHATEMTLRTLDWTSSEAGNVVEQYRFRSRVGDVVKSTPFIVSLPRRYFGEVFVLDGKRFAAERGETAFSYANSLEQYIRLKSVPSWKTELDLLPLWSGDGWTTPNKEGYCMQLLVPSMQIGAADRFELINAGLSELASGGYDLALMLRDDMRGLDSSDVEYVASAGEFCVVAGREELSGFADETAEYIESLRERKP